MWYNDENVWFEFKIKTVDQLIKTSRDFANEICFVKRILQKLLRFEKPNQVYRFLVL